MPLATSTAALIGGGLLAGGAGLMSTIGGAAKKAVAPAPLPKPPSPEDASAKAAEMAKKKKAMMSQTTFTSPLGLGGQAQVARKTLLGE